MSLIPYHAQEGREIVLRHRNAIVVRDSQSQRIELRGVNECPTCRRPVPRSRSPDRAYNNPYEMHHESYVDPEYFRILQAGIQNAENVSEPSSPVRSLLKPALANGPRARATTSEPDDSFGDDYEPARSSQTPGDAQASHSEGNRIRKQAFSPGYFKTFFKEEKVLGRGGKGVVLLVRHEIDDCDLGHYACKRVPVGDDHAWLEKVLVEVGVLNKLTHPNLVSYRHVWLEKAQLTRFGPSVVCAFILQQYCNGGDLHQYIIGGAPREATKEELKARMRRRSKGQVENPSFLASKPQLSFEEIYSLFKDITSGVAYLHSANYIHRDLKPSNCLLHWEGGKLRCLISDFGEVQHENVSRKSTGSTGTISYCAPEVIQTDASGRYGNFTTKSDIFSLGMILYFMCFGKLPYRSANALQEELEDIDDLRAEISGWGGFHDERRERSDLPSRLYQLLKKLLSLNSAERPSANDVLNAMRSESYSEGFARVDRAATPPLGLHGNRVQNLDSPAPPGTPVPDPRKPTARPREANLGTSDQRPVTPTPVTYDGATQLNGQGSLRNRTKSLSPRRAQPMGVSDGQLSPSIMDKFDEAEHDGHEPSSPPLLMAPPMSRANELRHTISLMVFRMLGVFGLDNDFFNQTFRLGLFLAKVTFLLQPCWPYLARTQIGLPLVLLAAVDLLLPTTSTAVARTNYRGEVMFEQSRTRSWAMSFVLLAVHVIAVWVAGRSDALCVTTQQREWDDWGPSTSG